MRLYFPVLFRGITMKFLHSGLAGFVAFVSLAAATPADAACRQMLAPNGWQYVTVCDSYRGGNNYGATAAAALTGAAIAIEMLPGIMDGVNGVTSGVVENLGNTASNSAEPLQNFLSSRNQNTGGLNDGSLNPFAIFSAPQVTQPTAPNVRTPVVNAPSAPQVNVIIPNIFAPSPATPEVRTPSVHTPNTPAVNTPVVNAPFPNIFANPTAPNVQTPRTNAPQASVRQPTVTTPTVNSSQP